MADHVVIATLIMNRCEAMQTEGPILPVAFPDAPFTPPANDRYLRCDLFTNAPAWEGLKSGRLDQGLLQVSVIWPRNTGAIEIRKAVSDVLAFWPKGLILSGRDTRLRINREPWAASPIIEDHQTSVPITVSWVAS